MPKVKDKKVTSKTSSVKTPIKKTSTTTSSALSEKLEGVKLPKQRDKPLWTGPCGEGANGGVSQSMIGRYLCCPERFRVSYIEGWQAPDQFEPKLEFGNMWHVCEEAYAAQIENGSLLNSVRWEKPLYDYSMGLVKKYPLQREQVEHWYSIALALFPLYVEYWKNHPDVQNRTPLLQEDVFDVQYVLPSGRIVRLRGKRDSLDLVGKPKSSGAGVWLQENKSKSSIKQDEITRQLPFDLQSMLYLIALREERKYLGDNPVKLKTSWHDGKNTRHFYPIKGIRYNVIRRAAHKSAESMLKKIADDQEDKRMGEWFARWSVEVSPSDLVKFESQCLVPVLENLCDDFEWWADCMRHGHEDGYSVWSLDVRSECFPQHKHRHFRLPHGLYNITREGGISDVDAYLESGSTAGLKQREALFGELQ